MPRTYDLRAAALTVDVPLKWLDNLLSQNELPGVRRSRQGVQRRISEEGLMAIELVRMLTRDLGVPVKRAAQLAANVVSARGSSEIRAVTESGMVLLFPAIEIASRLRNRVMDAVEIAGSVRRGRPPARRSQSVAQEKTPDV
jgi:hypothetical protein